MASRSPPRPPQRPPRRNRENLYRTGQPTIWDEPTPDDAVEDGPSAPPRGASGSRASAAGSGSVTAAHRSVGTVGERVGGRYRLTRPIARGGMAEVWEAHDDTLDRDVAVKMLHPHLADETEFVSRFRREALTVAKLSHPNLVSIFDTGVERARTNHEGRARDDMRAYLVMELIRGKSVRELLQHGLALERGIEITAQAAAGLGFAHERGLVHRDVKPANILVGDDGRVKVVDFGIAKATLADERGGEDLTQAGAILGTAKYLAPEQVEGETIDARTDLYSLGIVLYEIACGRPPFQGPNDLSTAIKHVREAPVPPRQVRPGIPRPLEDVILTAINKNPAHRFHDAFAFADALRAIDLSADDAVPMVSWSPATQTPPRGFPVPNERINTSPSAPISEQYARIPPSSPSSASSPLPTTPTPAGLPSASGRARKDARSPAISTPTAGNERASARRARWTAIGLVTVLAGLVSGAALGMVFGDRNARVNTGRAVAVATVAPFDPDATDGNRENNGLLRNLIDGKGETNWYTEGYGTRNLGGKSGVGFILRLRNERTEVNRLRIDTASGGWSAQIYVSDTDAKSLDGWGEPVGRVTNADRGVFSAKLTPTRGSVVLLWITDLGPKPANAKYIRVIINEVSPRTT